MKLTDKGQKSFIASPASGNESCVEETLLILQKSQYDPLLDLDAAVSKWMFSVPDLLGVLIRPSSIGKINSPCLGNITSFALCLK